MSLLETVIDPKNPTEVFTRIVVIVSLCMKIAIIILLGLLFLPRELGHKLLGG